MLNNVAVIFLEFTQAHEQSGLAALHPVLHRLFPARPMHMLVLDNADTRNFEIRVHGHLDRISGDNSCREFSAYDKGIRWFESCGMVDASTTFVIVNDTFHRSYGMEYLAGFTRDRLADAQKREGILGYIDAFPNPVTLKGLDFQKWIRSSFFIVQYPTLKRLLPLNTGDKRAEIFSGDEDPRFFNEAAPLSENYRQFLRTWLFEAPASDSAFKEEWHSKKSLSKTNVESLREKALCILCEHSFSARAKSIGAPLVASNFDTLPAQFR